MWVRPRKNSVVVLVCTGVLLSVLIAVWCVWQASLPPSPARAGVKTIVIEPGSSTAQIAALLKKEGLIRSSFLFCMAARLKKADGKLQAGEYQLSGGVGIFQLIDKLLKGQPPGCTVTVKEGLTVEEIAELVERCGLVSKQAFIEAAAKTERIGDFLPPGYKAKYPLEGYLFPDTYSVSRNMSAEQIIDLMVDRFRHVFSDEMLRRAAELNMTPHQVVTLASVIEKEAVIDSERPVISGVYHNRLRLGMKLDADPTVLYAVGKRNGIPTLADLNSNSAYNTYKVSGLPPGPICNPGRASIMAALYPAQHKFLYFVARNDGTHEFNTTYSAHIKSVKKYQSGK
ncbi:MAG TPA: endolytic transglycosylase MltG [Firmicutes bacterium]|nr:endolytic transglycosylase MltG [Bacillota bacterium]